MTLAWAVFGMFMGVWTAAQLAWPDLAFDAGWSSFGRLQADPYHRGDFRLRRQCPDRHLVPRRAADLPRPPGRAGQPLVRAARLQPVLHPRRHRLLHGRDPVEGIRRAGMVRRPVARRRLGHLLRALPAHARPAQGAAHLRRQLVLHGVHRRRGHPAHRQQPGHPGLASAMPRATRSGPACRTRWCSGGTATTRWRSSSPPASWACCTTTCPSGRSARSSPTGCRSSASGASPSSTCGRVRTTCTTRRCRTGCRTSA